MHTLRVVVRDRKGVLTRGCTSEVKESHSILECNY